MGKHRIIVLGSGVSGLGCAKELVSRGYEVLIVEARSRVGGRLKGESLELGKSAFNHEAADQQAAEEEEGSHSHTVDLGGALIHGIDNNPIHTISTQMGVPLHAISDYCLLLDENGWPFDPKEDDKISNLFNECLDITFQRITERKNAASPTTANNNNAAAATPSTSATTGNTIEPAPSSSNTTTTTTTTASASLPKSTTTTPTSNSTSSNTFGDLFDQVCREKGVSPDNPLLKWHQANLELPTGADFHQLGYTWNDDEPYGFSGDHAAIETSWKFVMDRLADGLDILYNSPVVKVQVVLPDGTTPAAMASSSSSSNNDDNNATATADDDDDDDDETSKKQPATEENALSAVMPPPPPPPPQPRRRSRRSLDSLLPTPPMRSSRRLRGEGVNVRRSTRSNKGVIQMMQIGDMGSLSYDDPDKKHTRRKRRRASSSSLDGGDDDGNASDDDNDGPPSSTVQVTLQNGTVLEASAVVCTLPLGVLKLPPDKPGHIRFLPPLPPNKRTAIEQLGCGLLNKCAISFPNVFWQDSDFLGLAGSSHSYLVLNATKYTRKPILIFMYGGSFAKELESWTDSQVIEDCLLVLKKICGKAIPDPVDYCVTRWGQEQYSRMAFTYIPPGVNGPQQLSTAGEAIYDPAVPNRPLIMFAGEHTTPYHPSTMHGAFLSGIREAYRYDLYIHPSLDLEFEKGDKIYEHTFVTRKVYKKKKKANTHNKNGVGGGSDRRNKNYSENTYSANGQKRNNPKNNNNNNIRSRRRRFAGMALRKQPKQVLPSNGQISTFYNTPQQRKTNGASSGTPERLNNHYYSSATTATTTTSTRRSQRSLSAKRIIGASSPSDEPPENTKQQRQQLINELEDRTLVRSLESYGRDCTLLRSKIVPVFGSKRRRTVDQIRSRWQQLVKRREKRPEIVQSWAAETIAPVPVFPTAEAHDHSSDADGNLRRSGRAAKPKVLMNV